MPKRVVPGWHHAGLPAGGDAGGFNGICARWMARFMKDRGLQKSYLAWLQANADAAWKVRRPATTSRGRAGSGRRRRAAQLLGVQQFSGCHASCATDHPASRDGKKSNLAIKIFANPEIRPMHIIHENPY